MTLRTDPYPMPPGAMTGPFPCQGCGARKWWQPTGVVDRVRTGRFVDRRGRRHSCVPANALREAGRTYWLGHVIDTDGRRAYKAAWMRRARAAA